MAHAATLLRSARKGAGLSQGELAKRVAHPQESISRVERGRDPRLSTWSSLVWGTGHSTVLIPTIRAGVAELSAEIAQRLSRDDSAGALRALIQINDNLSSEHGLVRGALAIQEPATTAHRWWDAAIAALVHWRLAEEGLPLPAWVTSPSRYLPKAQYIPVDPADPIPPREAVPAAFVEHGVLIWSDTFASV